MRLHRWYWDQDGCEGFPQNVDDLNLSQMIAAAPVNTAFPKLFQLGRVSFNVFSKWID